MFVCPWLRNDQFDFRPFKHEFHRLVKDRARSKRPQSRLSKGTRRSNSCAVATKLSLVDFFPPDSPLEKTFEMRLRRTSSTSSKHHAMKQCVSGLLAQCQSRSITSTSTGEASVPPLVTAIRCSTARPASSDTTWRRGRSSGRRRTRRPTPASSSRESEPEPPSRSRHPRGTSPSESRTVRQRSNSASGIPWLDPDRENHRKPFRVAGEPKSSRVPRWVRFDPRSVRLDPRSIRFDPRSARIGTRSLKPIWNRNDLKPLLSGHVSGRLRPAHL